MIDLPALISRFEEHLDLARQQNLVEPTAFSLATVSREGRPSVRIMLLKGTDSRGFVFYTNTLSRKGRELGDTPRAAMCFWWGALARQVRVEGSIERVSDAEADAYFASRPRGSQIGAWASKQSSALGSREELLAAVARIEEQYAGKPVPRPPHWTGFRVLPDAIEFWYGRENRLHERLQYTLEGEVWTERILSP
ncbi:MAG TPA: pyridoxamine 5'-phosphate oxidase [Candidatus Krumholzibacteria bacterium]|nr:pyridoxamine 5'-phosphate oxidase [Candidatus Krumholzibacteria bacterium]